MTANALAKIFADLSDEALLKRFNSGALTEEAEAIAKAEIASRGLPLPEDMDGQDQQEVLSEDMVPVARNLLPIDAHVIQGRLEAEGIYAFVADENLMSALPVWVHAAYGGARVLVRSSQAEAAMKILAASRNDEYRLEDEENGQQD